MAKVNCWEYLKCGREPGGARVDELGVCPAATLEAAHGFLGGCMAGRGCMYVTGTFCTGETQGTHQEKMKECGRCEFYRVLWEEHGAELSVLRFREYVKGRKAG